MSQHYQEHSYFRRFAIVSFIGVMAVACVLSAPFLGLSVKHAALPVLVLAAFLSNLYLEKVLAPIKVIAPFIHAVAEAKLRSQEIATTTVWQSSELFPFQAAPAKAIFHVAFAVCLAIPAAPILQGSLQGGSAMGPVDVIVVNEPDESVRIIAAAERRAEWVV